MRTKLSVVSLALVALTTFSAAAAFDTPVVKEWTVMEPDGPGKEKEVRYMTIDGIMVHETDPAIQPAPPVVTPGATPALPPSDAVVLFDGKDLSAWTSTEAGKETKWIVRDGALMPTSDSGMIQTKAEFGSCQLHIEWATPANVEGDGQGRGNSGVFLMGHYEIQILDSYENFTYPDGQAAALYGRHKPLVNACREPGAWQSYDIIFHRPAFKDGEVVKRATFTVLHNGVLVHDHVELTGGTLWQGPYAISHYEPHDDAGPLQLQDHGNPVRFRNIWIRPLED